MIPAPTDFTFEPIFLALAVVAGFFYFRSLGRDQRHVPWWRPAAFLGGLALIALSLNSPLETISAHWIADPGFSAAVEDFLERERQGVAIEKLHLEELTPFRKG